MPPKKQKAQKQSLGDFLANESLGSWADEMDSLPTAPAMRNDDDGGRSNDRYGRRDDFLSSRPDRAPPPPREDVPLPTQPPYTAFIGNLAFDLSEAELEDFFAASKTKSVKIIKDRDDKPKGFGYVEFEDLDGLKDALTKSGTSLSGRTIRVSVAEAPKERSGFGPADDGKFDSPWRRDGPLPDHPSRDSSRKRFDSLPSVSENNTDWRAGQRVRPPPPEPEASSGSVRRKNTGFGSDIPAGAADREDAWTIGGRFKPSEDKDSAPGNRFGSMKGRGDMGPPPSSVTDEGDWRTSSRPRPARGSTSPNSSTPPTPQMGRRKLELLPRSGNGSTVPSPLSSPKMGPSPSSMTTARSNPFGSARPVDVSARENEVAQRVEKDREVNRERMTMSRTSSRTGTERPPISRQPTNSSSVPPTPSSPKPSQAKSIAPNLSANVRPSFSFANAAAHKGNAQEKKSDDADQKDDVNTVADSLGEVTI